MALFNPDVLMSLRSLKYGQFSGARRHLRDSSNGSAPAELLLPPRSLRQHVAKSGPVVDHGLGRLAC